MEKLLNGADGLIARAPKGTIQEKAYNYLAANVKVCHRLIVLGGPIVDDSVLVQAVVHIASV